MTDSLAVRSPSRRRLIIGAVLTSALLAGYLLHPVYLSAVGRALIVEDSRRKADAILVLAGDSPQGHRVSHAVRLFKEGYAPILVLSGTPIGWQTHETEIMRRQAMHLGVPATQIVAVSHDSDSTKEEAGVIVPVLKQRAFRTVILVSANSHTARAKRVFERESGPQGPRFLASPVQDGAFEPEGWWTRRKDAKTFVYEALKTVWYWVAE